MPNRKTAHSGKGANTPTQTTTPTETSQPRECLNDTIKRLAAQLDVPNGYSVQTFMPLYEVICRKLERSATVASQHTSQLDRRALLDVECTISTAADQIAVAPGSLQKEWTEALWMFAHREMPHARHYSRFGSLDAPIVYRRLHVSASRQSSNVLALFHLVQ